MDNGNANEVEQMIEAAGTEELAEMNDKMDAVEGSSSKADTNHLTAKDLHPNARIIIDHVRCRFTEVIRFVENACPQCDESREALKKLVEANMWATKAIANPQ